MKRVAFQQTQAFDLALLFLPLTSQVTLAGTAIED